MGTEENVVVQGSSILRYDNKINNIFFLTKRYKLQL